MSADYLRITSVVAIYQAPQAAYDVFDKVSVLYEGQQIYFGRTTEAKDFFVRMGFECPEQQTTPDFLTSLSSPLERKPAAGFQGRVPSSAQEFATAWRSSPEYAKLQAEIEEYNQTYPLGGERYEQFKTYRRSAQSKHMRHTSPYTLSYWGQVRLTFKRSWMRFKAEPALAITQIVFNIILALIVGSLYYNLRTSRPDRADFRTYLGIAHHARIAHLFCHPVERLWFCPGDCNSVQPATDHREAQAIRIVGEACAS